MRALYCTGTSQPKMVRRDYSPASTSLSGSSHSCAARLLVALNESGRSLAKNTVYQSVLPLALAGLLPGGPAEGWRGRLSDGHQCRAA
jgi:hypothetical protein